MRISVAQINTRLGDFKGNEEKIRSFAERALTEQGSDLVLFPELSLCGCPPLDLLEDKAFIKANTQALEGLARDLPPQIAVGLGYIAPAHQGKGLANMYGIILGGRIVFEQPKLHLSREAYFDEGRYFQEGQELKTFEYRDEKIGFVPATLPLGPLLPKAQAQTLSLLCAPSALPYSRGLRPQDILPGLQGGLGIPLVFINGVGANDEIIYPGASFIAVPQAEDRAGILTRAPAMVEDLISWDSRAPRLPLALESQGPSEELDQLEAALVLGIRDYMKKNGFSRIHLGLSGGLDSALVAYLAVQALGPAQVTCINNPSRFSSEGTRADAAALALNLGCSYEVIPIEECFHAFVSTLDEVFKGQPKQKNDVTEENLQARIRGLIWMAYGNKFNSILLSGGNKSEIAMGYCTLYGDTNGAMAPIGDLLKTEVFELCRRINQRSLSAGGPEIIPRSIIERPPSAELRPDQKDEDSLPPYEVLDGILRDHLYRGLGREELAEQGWDPKTIEFVLKTMGQNEFKRRQLPPALRVSVRPLGMGRRIPLSRILHEI